MLGVPTQPTPVLGTAGVNDVMIIGMHAREHSPAVDGPNTDTTTNTAATMMPIANSLSSDVTSNLDSVGEDQFASGLALAR